MEPNILFINACVREESRTLELAKHLLSHLEGELTEYDLEKADLRPLTRAALAKRDALLAAGDRSDPMLRPALDFAAADTVVVAAPYWDLSFPASVKVWVEHINCLGITFAYGPDDRPYGLCRAKRLYYVMTAGGPVFPPNQGFAYLDSLCKSFYGIPETQLFAAEGLDLRGADVPALMSAAKAEIDAWFRNKKL